MIEIWTDDGRHPLAGHPAYRALSQTIAELSLISHTAGTSYEGKLARDTSEGIGGNRPPGGDLEPRPRAPRNPPIEGDASSQKAWDDYEDELRAWRECYQRRTPAYFEKQRAACLTEHRLEALAREAVETLAAWKRTPIPDGQDPEYGSAQWKRWVAESKEDGGSLARRFNVSRQYIHSIRKAYRTAA